ncbi:hypothetical protein C1H46_031051 [Malus baccata]|uniref:Uncharacterized protein n=1 Tax=Malus baccata TaxID=106549 RepID=A0A540LA87_MALBA|nr:hypothetical protein C1H46_031051 [Malus baccata]
MANKDPIICFHKFPSAYQVLEELRELWGMAFPITVMNCLVFIRVAVSVLFLGRLGSLELAGGALSLGFTNITGYSVLVGLASNLEPVCSQAYGNKNYDLLSLSLKRMVLILLLAVIPISILWINLQPIMVFMGTEDSLIFAARRDAVLWMLKLNAHYGFTAFTAILAVNYFNRFISSFHFQIVKPWMVQLVAITCLSLAARVEETEGPVFRPSSGGHEVSRRKRFK